MCDRKGLRPKVSAEISVNFRPKQFQHYWLFSAIWPKEYFWPKMTISAENWQFRPKFSFSIMLSSSGWFSRLPWTLYLIKGISTERDIFGRNSQFSTETLIFGQKCHFRPKMSLTAVITVSVKFHLFRFKIFGFGVSPKILFRSHTRITTFFKAFTKDLNQWLETCQLFSQFHVPRKCWE